MRYAVVFAGSRDHYEVAVALAEKGQLHCLVNECYVPALPRPLRAALRWLLGPAEIRKRTHPGLRGTEVATSYRAFAASSLGRVFRFLPVIPWVDGALGRKCGRIAARDGVPILAYSYYAAHAFAEVPQATRKIVFQVHPHPTYIRGLLGEEMERVPQARNSLQLEQEFAVPPDELERLKRGALEADFVITPSTFAKKTLVAAGVAAERIAVVPYGTDPVVFAPKSFVGSGSATRPLRLIFVGSLVQRKGLSYLFEAMRRLANENVELVLMGRGGRDETLLEYYADVPRRIVWSAPREQLIAEMHAADVFIFPSLVESFALVLLEAMAVGLPVITTENTAGPDLIEEGRTGFVGPIRDVDFLVGRVRWFLANRAAIPIMGRACQAAAAKRDWPRFRCEIRHALAAAEARMAAAPGVDGVTGDTMRPKKGGS